MKGFVKTAESCKLFSQKLHVRYLGSKSGYAQLKKKIPKFFVVIASVQQKWGILYAPF